MSARSLLSCAPSHKGGALSAAVLSPPGRSAPACSPPARLPTAHGGPGSFRSRRCVARPGVSQLKLN